MKPHVPRAFSLTETLLGFKRDCTVYRHDDLGFTILELVIILAIVATLMTLSALVIPAWRDNINIKTTARDVVSNFQFARMEAAKRNATILVQVTVGGAGVGDCIVFIDNGQGGGTAGDLVPTGGEALRQVALPPKVSIQSTTISPYAFSNRGFPTTGDGTVRLTNGDRTYEVVLSPAGALRLDGPL